MLESINEDCILSIIGQTENNRYHISFGLTCTTILAKFTFYYQTTKPLWVEYCLIERQNCSCIQVVAFTPTLSVVNAIIQNRRYISFQWILNNYDIIPLDINLILKEIRIKNDVGLIIILLKYMALKPIPININMKDLEKVIETLFLSWEPMLNILEFVFLNSQHHHTICNLIMDLFERIMVWDSSRIQLYLDCTRNEPTDFTTLARICKNNPEHAHMLYHDIDSRDNIDYLTFEIIDEAANVFCDIISKLPHDSDEALVKNIYNSFVNVLNLSFSHRVRELINVMRIARENNIEIYDSDTIIRNLRYKIKLIPQRKFLSYVCNCEHNVVELLAAHNHFDLSISQNIIDDMVDHYVLAELEQYTEVTDKLKYIVDFLLWIKDLKFNINIDLTLWLPFLPQKLENVINDTCASYIEFIQNYSQQNK